MKVLVKLYLCLAVFDFLVVATILIAKLFIVVPPGALLEWKSNAGFDGVFYLALRYLAAE